MLVALGGSSEWREEMARRKRKPEADVDLTPEEGAEGKFADRQQGRDEAQTATSKSALSSSVPDKPKDPRQIRIVNETGIGKDTRFFDDTGRDITAALKVTGVDWSFSVEDVTKAVLHTIALRGEVSAEIVAIKETIVPPPLPVEHVKMTISPPVAGGFLGFFFGRKRSAYRVERIVPVLNFDTYRVAETESSGALVETLAEGWMAPIGPLEFTVDA